MNSGEVHDFMCALRACEANETVTACVIVSFRESYREGKTGKHDPVTWNGESRKVPKDQMQWLTGKKCI